MIVCIEFVKRTEEAPFYRHNRLDYSGTFRAHFGNLAGAFYKSVHMAHQISPKMSVSKTDCAGHMSNTINISNLDKKYKRKGQEQ